MTDQPQTPTVSGIKITVVSIGKQRTVTIPAGSTNADALTAAGFSEVGYALTLNGVGTQLHERPDNGDILALTPKVDGGC
ncbi:MAG: hypothetical protein C4523_15750 [Myxococcales bacterium]|nr:MAG: hypothetical protein C4523_15750 [Myxococcales bacterium]